jgi:hypothetical protein
VVIYAGHHLELGRVLEHHAAHHVHLPKLHGTLPLPPAELVPTLASTPQLDEAVAAQAPVDRRA